MKRVSLDMDGVVVDWLGAAVRTCNLEVTPEILAGFKEGCWIDQFVPDCWDYIDAHGEDWWANLEPLPWAKEVYHKLSSEADLCFLTSPGDMHKHPVTARNAAAGKIRWVANHFPGSHLMIGYSKYFCAHSQSLLVDDSGHKLTRFLEWGGHVFHWPSQYAILDGSISLDETMDKLLAYVRVL